MYLSHYSTQTYAVIVSNIANLKSQMASLENAPKLKQ